MFCSGRLFLTRIMCCAFLCFSAHCKTSSTQTDRALTVFSAASLRQVFTTLHEDFNRTHDPISLQFNFSGTQELRTQIEHGAHADIFASADWHHMNALQKSTHVSDAVVFTRNELVLVVSNEASQRIQYFSDLPKAKRIVLGAEEVPIGRYTKQVLQKADLSLEPNFSAKVLKNVVSRELNVKQVLSKVLLGEAEVGFVYRSDAHGIPIKIIDIPANFNVIAEYPIAVLASSSQKKLSQEWIDFLLSSHSQTILKDAGFIALQTSSP